MTGSADWTGQVGDIWAAEWQRTDRSFTDLDSHLIAAILASSPDGSFRALDIGCGAGATSHALACARGNADVVGIDLSAALIEIARRRAPLPNLRWLNGDALAKARDVAPVDLFVSRHGVMFFDDPAMAFISLAAAAAPGARLVFSCFADRRANRWAADLLDALGLDGARDAGVAPGPFAFADPERVHTILAAAGWVATAPRRVAFGYRAGAGADPVADAADFFQRIGPVASLLRDAAPDDRPRLTAAVADACARRQHDGVVDFPAEAWIWSATCPRSTP